MKLDYSKIELVMANKCLSKAVVAERYGANPATLSGVYLAVREGSDVQPITAGRLAKALGVDVEYLIDSPTPLNGETNGAPTPEPTRGAAR